MTAPRLLAAGAAIVLFIGALSAASILVQQRAARHVRTLAPQMFAEKNKGTSLQRSAFHQADLLPFYGSSDLNVPNPRHASAFFRDYPTGFTVFPVGAPGSTSLVWLQALAAVGADLHGRKLALTVSSRPFMSEMVDEHSYAANFSPLHANELAFSTQLSFAVKQAAARRMLQYPSTLTTDRLLHFALAQLADGSLVSRALYYASLPLGKLHNVMLRLRDGWQMLAFVDAQRGLSPVRRQSSALDWNVLAQAAERESRRNADNNPYGFENAFWASHAPEIAMQKGLYAAQGIDRVMQNSAEWGDLDLLLQAVRELGGEPLVLSIPMNGPYYDHLGVSAAVRQAFYDRLQRVTQSRGVLAVDFAAHDSDQYFSVDPSPHLSNKGWVHYNQALDTFFHQRPLENP